MCPRESGSAALAFERRTLEALEQVLEVGAGQRAAAIERVCAGDPRLREAVAALLEEQADEDWLEPANELADALLEERLGPWRIDSELGRGGMGTVYLARRDDGTYEQSVAVKVVRRGFESRLAAALFERERELLARLEHPSVARLVDGGVTQDGRPWLAMELVDGVPIDRWCDAHELDVRARVALAREACEAVAWLHQQLVVHRDLKPSNVFVTPEGRVRLLDFGIAKVLGPIEEGGDATRGLGRIWTPDYASPEQMSGGAVSTRSDVYSLGVALFRLLTGSKPYRTSGLSDRELARTVCEVESPRASSVATDERVARALSGDLDAIVQRCLEKDPEARYESARHLTEDLDRYLSGYPVQARPASHAYRARKWVARHRGAVAAGVLLAGVGTLAVVGQQRAAQASERVDSANQDLRASALRDLFEIDRHLSNIRGTLALRRLVIQDAIQRLELLEGSGATDPEVTRALASAWLSISELQWHVRLEHLDEPGEALRSVERCFDWLARARESDGGGTTRNAHTLDSIEVSARLQRSVLFAHLQRLEDAFDELEVGRTLVGALYDRGEETHSAHLLAECIETAGLLLLESGASQEEIDESLRENLVWLDEQLGADPHDGVAGSIGSQVHGVRRLVRENRGPEAKAELLRILSVLEYLPEDTAGADVARWRAIVLMQLIRVEQAGDAGAETSHWLEEAAAAWERRLESHPEDLVALRDLGDVLKEQADAASRTGPAGRERALQLLLESAELKRRRAEIEIGSQYAQFEMAIAIDHVGDLLLAEQRYVQALGRYREALPIFEGLAASDESSGLYARDHGVCLHKISQAQLGLMLAEDDPERAAELREEVIETLERARELLYKSTELGFHRESDEQNFASLEEQLAELKSPR